MKKHINIVFAISLTFLLMSSAIGQNAFRSGDEWTVGDEWNTNLFGTSLVWGGAVWDLTNTNPAPNDRYFRFYTDYGGCLQEWGPSGNLQMNSGVPISLTAGSSSAYFANVQSNTYHYIFRTRITSECVNPEAVYFEIQGDVRTISSVSQSPTNVFPGQNVVVTANLSGTNNTGQGYYLRYTTDGFTTSTVLELSGSGTSFSATIPSSVNMANVSLDYYVFSSGSGLTIAPTDADFFTFSLNNNGGSYSYIVAPYWESAMTGNWETASTWTANAIPTTAQPIQIAAGHIVTTSNSSSIDFSSLNIVATGSLNLGANSTFTLSEFNGITSDGSIVAGLNSVLQAPYGGYLSSTGSIQLYDLEIGVDAGVGNFIFYLNSNLEISNNLRIEENGELRPGNAVSVVLEMSGALGNVYNDGRISSIPDLGDINNERLAFLFSGAQTILRGNGGLSGDRTSFSDITIANGASLISDAAGTLNAELQFGTLTNNGSFNMGQTATGRVNFTLRGTAANNYFFHSDNINQSFQFSNLTIGSDGSNDGGDLQLNPSSEDIVLSISGDFQNYYKFTHTNSDPAKMAIIMNGTVDQNLIGQNGQTNGNQTIFGDLEIANSGGNVFLTSIGPDPDADNNISYEIEGILKLTSGKLISLNGGNRHNLILGENASIDAAGAQSDESGTPCYIEGPILKRASNGNVNIDFPVGQGEDYRPLSIATTVSNGPVIFKVEHFAFSANFVNMSIVAPVINISDIRFWNLEVDDQTKVSGTSFTLAYGDADTDGVTQESDLRVVWAAQDASTDGDITNNNWIKIGDTGGLSNSITSGAFDFLAEGINKIDITLGNIGSNVNPLPVTWLSFTCTRQYETNLLKWATASEINSDYFVLERASDDFIFREISTIQAQGWSNETVNYYFIDQSPISGNSYYRLRQVDFDGAFEYSIIISSYKANKTNVYPNPFSDVLYFIANDSFTGTNYEIRTSLGAKIMAGKLNDGQNKISTNQLLNGTYIVRVTDETGNLSTYKLIKLD